MCHLKAQNFTMLGFHLLSALGTANSGGKISGEECNYAGKTKNKSRAA